MRKNISCLCEKAPFDHFEFSFNERSFHQKKVFNFSGTLKSIFPCFGSYLRNNGRFILKNMLKIWNRSEINFFLARNYFFDNYDCNKRYKNEIEGNKAKICSRSSYTVSHKIDFKVYVLQRDDPPAWELMVYRQLGNFSPRRCTAVWSFGEVPQQQIHRC